MRLMGCTTYFVGADAGRFVLHHIVPSSFLLLVVRPGAPSSVLAPSSDALCS